MQVTRQSQYETRIQHLLNELRIKDLEIERLSAALQATTEQVKLITKFKNWRKNFSKIRTGRYASNVLFPKQKKNKKNVILPITVGFIR